MDNRAKTLRMLQSYVGKRVPIPADYSALFDGLSENDSQGRLVVLNGLWVILTRESADEILFRVLTCGTGGVLGVSSSASADDDTLAELGDLYCLTDDPAGLVRGTIIDLREYAGGNELMSSFVESWDGVLTDGYTTEPVYCIDI